tara:strand:+ start:193 stop:363 length:171 start_codon:yes stop_codon:yes gene_type:complete
MSTPPLIILAILTDVTALFISISRKIPFQKIYKKPSIFIFDDLLLQQINIGERHGK